MSSSIAYHPLPPPTDGPNTRQRSAAGLPPVSGSIAPLPNLDELGELSPWSAVSQEFSNQSPPVSGASFYPTPALAGCDVFSSPPASASSASGAGPTQRVVSSTGSIIDHGSPTFPPEVPAVHADLPEFAIEAPIGSSFGLDLTPFPVTTSPAGAGFGFDSAPADLVTPSPHMTMTKEEWLRLGGFTDDSAPVAGSSSALHQPAAEYSLPPPPIPQGYRAEHYSYSSSYSGFDGYESDRWSSSGMTASLSSSSSRQSLTAPSPLAGWAGRAPTANPAESSSTATYTFPSPASSQASPARDRGQSRRAQARMAPSPSLPATRARRDPYPTTTSRAAFEQSLAAEAESQESTQSAPSIAPAPSSRVSLPSTAASSTQPVPEAALLPAPNPARKSHARKASVNHIPRPRNAFILFRSAAVLNGVIPTELGLTDHKNISKVIGEIWRGLGDEERRVWERMAEVEKQEHARKYPGYTYKPKKREDRLREREEEKARASAGKPQRVRNRSRKDQPQPTQQPQQLQADSVLVKSVGDVKWDDNRCRAAAQAGLEGEDNTRIVAKVEQVLVEQTEEEQQGSSQETVKGKQPVVDSAQMQTRSQVKRESISVFTLPRQIRISPTRPALPTMRSSPADARAATALPQHTPYKQTNLLRRSHSSSEGSPTWHNSPASTVSSDSTASPSSAQRAAQQQRLEMPTPTRGPHPFAQSPFSGSRLQKQQSFAMAGLGISAPGSPPGAFARGASQWTSIHPSATGASLPSLLSIQPAGGFDSTPLLGGGGSRNPSLGRWELRLPSQTISSRELAAQALEEEYTHPHAHGGSGQSMWEHQSGASRSERDGGGTQFGGLDPSEFLEALVDGSQSEAPSWDSGHQPSSQSLTSSSHGSSHYGGSISQRLPSWAGFAGGGAKDGRVPSFHLGGQDLFAAPSGEALFGAPRALGEEGDRPSQAMAKFVGRTASGILGPVTQVGEEQLNPVK